MKFMISDKVSAEKLSQIRETINTSRRMVALVWSIDKWLFSGAIVATIIPAIIPFINIYIYKLVIDLVVEVVGGASLDASRLYFLVGLRVLTYFIQEVALRTQDYLERLLWTKVPIQLNHIVFKKISSLDIQYFEDSNFKDLLEKVRDSYAWKPQQLVEHILYSAQSFVQVAIAFATIAHLNLFLVILVASVAVPEFINQTVQSKLSWGVWSSNTPHRKRFWYISGLLQHFWTIKEVKLFRLAGKFLEELRDIQTKFYIDTARLAKRSYSLNLVFNALSTAVFIGVEVFVIFEALARRITIGDINFYTGVVSNFQNGLGGLFRNMNGVFENSLYVKSIFEVLDTKPIIPLKEKAIKVNFKKAPRIEFRDVDFAYPATSKKILKGFSLTIEPGEKIAFVGENGAGKTTIIKLLTRFYDIDKGEILIDGVNIKDLDLDSWYDNFGVLFQDFNKYEHTAKENIYFGKVQGPMDLKKIVEAAVSSGANQMIREFDKGYEQMLGRTFEEGMELSGGQWQKIALARAFFRNAPVLVLDEPTASIDAKAESEIFNRVEKLSKDKTVIIISHRFSTVRNADKIYVVDNGKIVESGTHQQLMKIDGQYTTLFKLQAKGYQ